MLISNYLAIVWGLSIVVALLALLVREKNLKRLFASVAGEEDLFLWGVTAFVIGITSILSHNIWVKNWQVIVTLLGWVSLIKGVSLLIFPECVKGLVKKIENKPWLPIAMVAGIFLGLVLTYFGFTA